MNSLSFFDNACLCHRLWVLVVEKWFLQHTLHTWFHWSRSAICEKTRDGGFHQILDICHNFAGLLVTLVGTCTRPVWYFFHELWWFFTWTLNWNCSSLVPVIIDTLTCHLHLQRISQTGILVLKTFIYPQVLIPISLYVSMEVVKLFQVYFISNDLELYYPEMDQPVLCRALNINEDLGQIKYVFSDKTGTLTENKMVFKRCTIGGRNFPHKDKLGKNVACIGCVEGNNSIWSSSII